LNNVTGALDFSGKLCEKMVFHSGVYGDFQVWLKRFLSAWVPGTWREIVFEKLLIACLAAGVLAGVISFSGEHKNELSKKKSTSKKR
jgi:hypothetical protein